MVTRLPFQAFTHARACVTRQGRLQVHESERKQNEPVFRPSACYAIRATWNLVHRIIYPLAPPEPLQRRAFSTRVACGLHSQPFPNIPVTARWPRLYL